MILFAYCTYSAYNTYCICVRLLFSSFMAGYELSDDEGDIPPSPSQSPQPPVLIQQPPIMIAPPPSFDFHDFMPQSQRRSGGNTASLCSFAFTSSTTVPVAAGDKLIQAVGNVNIYIHDIASYEYLST